MVPPSPTAPSSQLKLPGFKAVSPLQLLPCQIIIQAHLLLPKLFAAVEQCRLGMHAAGL